MTDISIIVPVYNLEKKLSNCVESLISQTFENIEIILVKDGSKDDSLKICKYYQNMDKRIILIDIPNGGVEKARLEGLKKSSGKYVMYVDGDDWIANNACEILYTNAEKTDADVVIANNFRVIGKKNLIKKSVKCESDYILEKPILFDEFYISFFGVNKLPVTMWGKLYKRELIINNLPPIFGLNHGEDLCFNMHLFPFVNKISVISEKIYYYRYGGMTNKMNDNLFIDACKTYEIKIKYLKKYNYFDKAEIYTAIELKNFLNTYIIDYFTYTKYSKEKIIKEINNAIENSSFKSALKIINDSKYKNKYIQLLIDNEIEKYIDYLIPNKTLLKLKYKIKYLIYKIVELVC